MTVLQLAVCYAPGAWVKRLLELGANVHIADKVQIYNVTAIDRTA